MVNEIYLPDSACETWVRYTEKLSFCLASTLLTGIHKINIIFDRGFKCHLPINLRSFYCLLF